MNRLHTVNALAGGLLLGTLAVAGDYRDYRDSREPEYDYAEVVGVDPMTRQVRVVVPHRECYSETRYVPVNRAGSAHQAAAPMILGGLIGAVIGNQIGNRDTHHAGAVAGGLIGAAIGHDAAGRQAASRGGYGPEEVRPVESERCEVRNEERIEERVDGYRVTYRYNGRTYTTRMSHDPGQRIRVRVSVDALG